LRFSLAIILCLLSKAQSTEAGRRLFQGETHLAARLANSSDPLPAAATACSNCHGRSAQGGREAGVEVASLAWHKLSRQLRYDETSFCRAIREGVSPSGSSLSLAMPRYNISTAHCAGLWHYLRDLELATLHGASTESIQIALISPNPNLDAVHLFRQAVDAVNQRGGIWGRRLEFLSATTPPPAAGILIYEASKPPELLPKRLTIVWHDEAPDSPLWVVSPSLPAQAKAALSHLPKATRIVTSPQPTLWEQAWIEAAEQEGFDQLDWASVTADCQPTSPPIALIAEHPDSIPPALPRLCPAGTLFFRQGDSSRLGPHWSKYKFRPPSLDASSATALVLTISEALEAAGRKLLLRDIEEHLSASWRARSGESNRLLRVVQFEDAKSPGIWRSVPELKDPK
jgi:cytochrome c553